MTQILDVLSADNFGCSLAPNSLTNFFEYFDSLGFSHRLSSPIAEVLLEQPDYSVVSPDASHSGGLSMLRID